MTDSVGKNVKVENDSSRPAGFEPGLSVLERYAVKVARTVLRGGGDGNVASLPECAEHVRQFGGVSPLPNLMEVKG